MKNSTSSRFVRSGLRWLFRAGGLPAVLALAAFAVPTRSLAQPNLLVAGGFEGLNNPLDGYARQTAAGVWGSESAAVSGTANGITPLGSQMLQLNHSGGGTAAQTNQIVKGPFKAGSVVTFSVKFNSWLTSSSIAPFPLQVAVSVGNAVLDSDPNTDNRSGPAVSSPLVVLDTDTSTWQTATVTTTLTSDTDYLAAELYVKMNSNGAAYGTPLAYADDAILTVIPPTPGTNWVNWTGSETVAGVTKYVGQLVVPRSGGGSTTVTVKYRPPTMATGAVGYPGICFPIYSTSQAGPWVTDYWTQGLSGSLGRNSVRSPYTSAKVTSIPNGGGAAGDAWDIIALQFAGTNTLEFTDASTGLPVSIASPVFAYVSLNGNGYGFDKDFDILSYGDGSVRDSGYWGAGTSYKNVTTVGGATQYQLLGTGEPHGTLQFRGSFNTVTWQSLSNEAWNGFTIGVAQLADDVPIANAGPDQTVNATSASGAVVTLSGSASGSTKTPYTYAWTGSFGTVTGQNPSVALPIGNNQTVTLYVTDSAGTTDSDTVLITVLPNPAPVITSPTSASGVYGSAFSYTITATNSPTGFGAANLPPGLTLSGAVISGTPTQAGLFGVNLTATNSGGTGPGSVLINIAKADATVSVTPYSVTFDGQPHSATATITGVNGDTGAAIGTVTLNTTHTDAGTYTDSWTFTGSANYNNIPSTAITDTIAKATATVTVNGYTGTYDGAAHGATGTATGVGGANLSGSLNLGASFTNAPGGTATWTFTGGTNYADATGTASIVINKANAAVVVAPYHVTYDATAHSATVTSIAGVNGESGATVGSVALNSTHTNAGTYTDSWTFTGTGNYNNIAATTINDSIAKADATVTVNGYTGTYDGAAHGATGSATGVGGVDLSSGLNLGGSFTNAPGGTAGWTFAGGNNYNDQSGSVGITINKANASVLVTPYSVEFDGNPHSATVASISGVNGETGSVVGSVTLNSTHTSVGVYADSWSFTGGTNYKNIGATPITDDIHDTTAPVVASVTPSQATLWPPNHQMVAITLRVAATDLVGVVGYQVSATSSEPDNGLGDGDTPNDIQIAGNGTLNPTINLRAERSGTGSGRTYTITVKAFDAAGNVSTAKTCTVSVPKSQGGK